MSKLKIYFCPNCRSADVRRIFEFGNLFGLMPTWCCGKCNFKSPVFPMAVGDSETVKKLNSGKNRNKKTIRKTKTTRRKK